MDKRQELILKTIIKEHIKTGAPVGSGVLVEKYKIDISPATARNEMSVLENEGYIRQPHTSAGRVPTEKAYRYYLVNLKMNSEKSTQKKNDSVFTDLGRILAKRNEQSFKEVSKIISSLSGNAVFWAFHRHNLYYTGMANLFAQPEFSELSNIYDISAVIDHIDEIINEIFEKIGNEVEVLIGSANPFGNQCSTIIAKYRLNDQTGLFGIIGPMRMNYEKNIKIVEFVNKTLSN